MKKKNVTICLSSNAIRTAKLWAFTNGRSMSGLIENLIIDGYKKEYENAEIIYTHKISEAAKYWTKADFKKLIEYMETITK